MTSDAAKRGVEERGRSEYEKPEVTSEEVFETLALTCTKAVGQCQPIPGETVAKS
jgi:hypothetical protein